MNKPIDEIPELVEKAQIEIAAIKELTKQQFEDDMDNLKLYAGKGITRLDSLGAIEKLCEIIEKRIKLMIVCLEQANEAARSIEVKQ